jgi:predicted PhzF superfamily epimerase YddE/YHI9
MLRSKTTVLINYRLRTLEPPKEDLKKERQVVIKLGEQEEVEALRKLPTKDLIERLKRQTGDTQAPRGVIAVRQLGSGDILIHVESKAEKERLEHDTQWIARIRASATIKKRTYRVLVYGIRVADFPRSAGQANAKLIEEENRQLHSELNIKSVA